MPPSPLGDELAITPGMLRAEIADRILRILVELIRLGATHGINIEQLMREAAGYCDAEPPFSN